LILVRWAPAVVFAALTFLHAGMLPPFEGMDEPAHFSSVLYFAARSERPLPGAARLHRSVEAAVALTPGPYHQWEDADSRLAGISYKEWRALPREERQRREHERAALTIDRWQDGELENWEAQHPPLYYAIVGYALRASGVSGFTSAHRLARFVSAAIFSTTGIFLTLFLSGRWGASPTAVLFVCLLPMWRGSWLVWRRRLASRQRRMLSRSFHSRPLRYFSRRWRPFGGGLAGWWSRFQRWPSRSS
jgi:hypothetical protein